MADMILVYRVMPEDGEVEYETLEKVVKETVEGYDSSVQLRSINKHNVGFGLLAAEIDFRIDENKGTEEIEEKLRSLPEVGEVILQKMDRL